MSAYLLAYRKVTKYRILSFDSSSFLTSVFKKLLQLLSELL